VTAVIVIRMTIAQETDDERRIRDRLFDNATVPPAG